MVYLALIRLRVNPWPAIGIDPVRGRSLRVSPRYLEELQNWGTRSVLSERFPRGRREACRDAAIPRARQRPRPNHQRWDYERTQEYAAPEVDASAHRGSTADSDPCHFASLWCPTSSRAP